MIGEADASPSPCGRGSSDHHPDDELAAIVRGLDTLRRSSRTQAAVLASAPDTLRLVHEGLTPWEEFLGTPAGQIEGRICSTLFDVDEQTWAAVVEPVLARLRALPDPDRPRTRRNRHPLVVHPLVVWESVRAQ